MKTLPKSLIFFGFILLVGCEKGPKPIMYGNENCDFCSMTIMDDKHASEIVTQKGKVYKFDSIECMIRSLEYYGEDAESILVMDFKNPGAFIDANTATFLISPDLPSPMGANLTAFQSSEDATESGFEGAIYTWETIRVHIN